MRATIIYGRTYQAQPPTGVCVSEIVGYPFWCSDHGVDGDYHLFDVGSACSTSQTTFVFLEMPFDSAVSVERILTQR